MPINLPTNSTTVKDRIKTDIQIKVPLSNPFIRGSWLRAFAESLGERMYDFYYTVTQAIVQIFPDTTIDNLDRWGSFYNISRLAATRASGTIVFQGTSAGLTIPLAHKFTDSDGNIFSSTETKDTAANVVVQSTLTQTGGIATFVGTSDHNFNNGDEAVITGAADALYNGTFAVTPTSDNTFTYEVPSGAGASTTGATFTNNSGFIAVQADVSGLDSNLDPFTSMTLQTPISGIDDGCGANTAGFTGGADQEETEAFRDRLLDIIRNPVAHFNVSDITRIAKAVSLVTRVFVQEVTPSDGQVTIYPMVDNESNTIPGAATVTAVKNAVLAIKPANTSDADVIVSAPTGVDSPFVFTAASLNPDTSTMRTSIENNLKQFFAESVEVGTDVTEDSYRAAIQSTVDTITGDAMISFALTAPSGDLAATSSQIRTLGSFTWL